MKVSSATTGSTLSTDIEPVNVGLRSVDRGELGRWLLVEFGEAGRLLLYEVGTKAANSSSFGTIGSSALLSLLEGRVLFAADLGER